MMAYERMKKKTKMIIPYLRIKQMGINWLIIDVFKICKNTACLSNDKIAIML